MSRITDVEAKAVLITGATSGIGAELARAFAAPLGRIGEARDFVGAFLFLASDDLAGYITGNTVHVNGGMFMP